MLNAAKKFQQIDYVAGIEARGFIFGSVLANRLDKGFIPVRKPGKLPADVLSQEYELEYGRDSVEVHVDAILKGKKYLVVDDLLATGGTSEAACRLIENGGGVVVGCLFLIELTDLGGRQKLRNRRIESIVEFEGE
jgi:adenine phosphoribosyltransferase